MVSLSLSPSLSYFTTWTRNLSSKIKRFKATDYLMQIQIYYIIFLLSLSLLSLFTSTSPFTLLWIWIFCSIIFVYIISFECCKQMCKQKVLYLFLRLCRKFVNPIFFFWFHSFVIPFEQVLVSVQVVSFVSFFLVMKFFSCKIFCFHAQKYL